MAGHNAVSKVFSSTATPLTVTEFVNAILKTWNPARGSSVPRLFGLAVSGGVDSMALAALCSRLQHEKSSVDVSGVDDNQRDKLNVLIGSIRFQSFVVDHGVRDGSDEEAHAVTQVLRERGIAAQILTIDWKELTKPGELPNFESLARRYRYQLLGKACRALSINSLLLGHHADDQVENVMIRLTNGHGMLGLRGMRAAAAIPECYGLHAIHESGQQLSTTAAIGPFTERSRKMDIQDSVAISAKSSFFSPFTRSSRQLAVESGGIKIHRPFLEFSKARLVATCQSESMKWFEDHSNNDPTLTIRNAVRHVINSYTLPSDLSKSALLQLSETANSKYDIIDEAAKALFPKCEMRAFETRSGMMEIQFPCLDTQRPPLISVEKGDLRLIAALLLRRVIELITPNEHVSMSAIDGHVELVFPKLRPMGKPDAPEPNFTVAGVLFRRISQPGPAAVLSRRNESTSDTLQDCAWLISRQPYKSLEHPVIKIQPALATPKGSTWSKWTLYDGRFWIRVANNTADVVLLRPFCADDMKTFRESLSKEKKQVFGRLLKQIAPGDVRWTLPTILRRDKGGQETILALPTFGLKVAEQGPSVAWEVRYKKINMAP